jgi:hypothetical protein
MREVGGLLEHAAGSWNPDDFWRAARESGDTEGMDRANAGDHLNATVNPTTIDTDKEITRDISGTDENSLAVVDREQTIGGTRREADKGIAELTGESALERKINPTVVAAERIEPVDIGDEARPVVLEGK